MDQITLSCVGESRAFCGTQELYLLIFTTSDTFSFSSDVELSLQLISSCFCELVWATGFWWESEGKEVVVQVHKFNPKLGEECFTR